MSAIIENDNTLRAPRLEVAFASTTAEIVETQKLRYRIFAGELGAQIDGGAEGIDHDVFDHYCRHLLVRDTATGQVVACTRILTGSRAPDAGGFYSESEFDLSMLDALPGRFTVPERSEAGAEAAGLPTSRTHSRYARSSVSVDSRIMEIGRTCVDRNYRSGAAITTLWSGIAAFVTTHRYDYLFGCASIGLEDGGATAHAILASIRSRAMAPDYQRVRPFIPLPASDSRITHKPKMPPLLKAYISLGAKACGEAYWDRDFNCADVFMLLNVSDLNPRYARHFLERNADTAAPHHTLLA
ncbi:MAG: GNAT family N-acetyltransferase [Stenotrophobium sp.]